MDPSLNVTTQASHNSDYSFGTFPASLDYETPAYYSMDAPRAVRLVYRSSQASPVGMVQLGVHDMSGYVPVYYTLRLLRPNSTWVTFTNGTTQMYYAGGMSNRPITAQFDALSLTTGAYSYTAVVAAVYADSSRRETSHPVRVVVLNERYSELGWGWSIAGMNRLYVQSDGAVVTTGEGQAGFHARACSTCAFVAPPGDFTVLRTSGSTYVRTHPDSTRETYNAAGRIIYVDDRVGNRTSFSYDASNRISTMQDPAGLVTTFAYDAAGKLAGITTPGGRVVQVSVNSSGNLASIHDPRGVALQATYLSNRRVSTHTDRNGGVTQFHYHSTGALDSLRLPLVPVLRNGVEVSVRPTYRYGSFEEAVAPPAGTGTASAHAPQVYTAATTVTDPRGHTTTAWINRFGLPEGVENPVGGTTTMYYDGNGNQTYRRDPNGRESWAWWTGPRLDSTYDASTGRRVRYQYGAFNQVTQISNGAVTQSFSLNAHGLVQVAYVNGGSPTTYGYDVRGRVTQVTDPMGHITRAYYNPAAWLNTDSVVGDTAGLKTVFGYDGYGRVRTSRNALNRTTTYIADALNRDSVLISPAGDTTKYAYTGEYMTGVTLPGGATYSTTVNALGWVRSRMGPAPGTLYRYHDENGNLVRSVNRRAQAVAYVYDAMDRVVARTADGQTSTFAYDPQGLWSVSSNPEATDTIWFNTKGQKVRAVTVLGGFTWQRTYAYDASGRPTLTRVQSDRGRDWYWEDAQHCDSLWPGAHGKQECMNIWQVNHSYDAAGQLSYISANGDWLYGDDEYDPYAYYPVFTSAATFGYNGDRMLTSTTVGSVTFTQGYSRIHALGSITFSQDSINTALGGRYERDLLGRTLSRYNSADTGFKWYDYDLRGQLQRFGTGVKWNGQWSQGEDWDSPFDRAGNPADSGAVVAAGNRLQSYRTIAIGYDADGNMISQDNSFKRSQFEWNSLGQLTWVNDEGQQTDALMGYDARGRRVRKSGSYGTTYYLYDGSNVIAEIAPQGNVKRVYTYYPGTDRPHSMLQNDSVYYYLTDEPGHVVGLVRPNGSLANRYEYTPFGELRFARESVPNDLQYNARQWDDEGALYYFRARYYDPYLRRFISEDPAGLAGGRNLYAYAGNDPINFYDHSGMSPENGDCRWSYGPAQAQDPDGDRYENTTLCLDPITVTADPEQPYEGNPEWENADHWDGWGGVTDRGATAGTVETEEGPLACMAAISVATATARDRRIKADRHTRAVTALRGAEAREALLRRQWAAMDYRDPLTGQAYERYRGAVNQTIQMSRAREDAREDLTTANAYMFGAAMVAVAACGSPSL